MSRPGPDAGPLLAVAGLEKRYPVPGTGWRAAGRRRSLQALAGVDLTLGRRECLAVVGESGSGKTTLGRCAVRLVEPTAGTVRFAGRDLLTLPAAELRRERRRFQMVFQDPFGSLDPRHRIGSAIAEPLVVHRLGDRGARRRRTEELLDMVGLPVATADHYPHELSGGQRQRVAIARALATGPELLIADEPVSSLDVSVRAQVINLLAGLQERLGLGMMFIAHDLALVEHLADRVAVMYAGRVVEEARTADLFSRPQHPYTVSLLAAVPVPDPAARRGRGSLVAGEPPSPVEPPPGCPFHPRCPIARERCRRQRPPLAALAPPDPPVRVACFYPGELAVPGRAALTGSEHGTIPPGARKHLRDEQGDARP